jgi:hypothetical protein
MENNEDNISFYQGGDAIGGENCLKNIKQKIAELSNIKNVSFLLGAGASSDAIPSMKAMQEEITKSMDEGSDDGIRTLYKSINSDNLEEILTILYANKHYLQGVSNADEIETSNVEKLIKHIEDSMYSKINIDLSSDNAEKSLGLYKQFYQKTALRNKDLSRVNIFTTNNDLFNEKALDTLNINYNNGFGGGLERVFNPGRFHYTFSKKIDANLEKFEPLENMVYLYKLHGSISWIGQDGNSLFNIQEIPVTGGETKGDESHVLIYPTLLKQAQSLGSPYADLIREFQTKLSLPNSVIFIIGYSFSDEHLNNIIYQALASNSSISVVIFGEYKDCSLAKIKDSRIFRIFGTDDDKPYENDNDNKVHYFKYIVEKLLPNVDENIDTTLLDAFVSSLNALKSDDAI